MRRDKVTRYFKRTVEHIHRVQKNMVLVVTDFRDYLGLSDEECRELIYSVMNHDRSKFSLEQFAPYVELTEFYHQRKTLGNSEYDYPSESIKEAVEAAWKHHYTVENHHPDKFAGNIGKWSKLEAIECVCDLQAMAQEFDEGTCRKFFEEIWKKKHSKNFYDDFNWAEVQGWMNSAIQCFEDREVL